jgi:transcriptional regulator with XRE-family HTH domain
MVTEFSWVGDVRAGGLWFKRLREGREWTQRDVDRRTGGKVSGANISQIEIGAISKPAMAMLVELGKVYGVTPNEIAEAYGLWSPAATGESEPAQIKTAKATLERLGPGQRLRLLTQIETLARMAEREAE